MSQSITLSREEQAALDEILSRELETTRTELHHTDDHTYRRIVKRHIELTQQMLTRLRELPTGEYAPSSKQSADRASEASRRGQA
ncbi:MAG: hypothetical protein ACOCVI_01470 [Planctomycetota bacterium]